MSDATPAHWDMGLADFVAKLVTETFESVIAASASQEERMAALIAATELDLAEFAGTAITDDLLEAALARLFPDGQGGSSLAVGAPVPDAELLDELDLVLARADMKGGKLTAKGVAHVRDSVALYLAAQQLQAFREARARGIPRIRVDKGVLRARVDFSAVDQSSTEQGGDDTPDGKDARVPVGRVVTQGADTLPVAGKLAPLRERLNTLTPLQTRVLDTIRHTRLMVSTPRDEPADGDSSTRRSTAYGEVEIHFRVEA